MGDLIWRKAHRSSQNGDNCVELAEFAGAVAVRDSKHPETGHLTFSRSSLRTAILSVADR